MYSYELKIPKERVAVLIGKKGEIKRRLQRKLKIKIEIDSAEGIVVLSGEDSLALRTGQDIINAVGRGFNPEIAELLLNEDFVFEMVDITEFSGKSKNKLIRLRGRVIGERGRSRRIIERVTNTNISVYGKSVGIIGKLENASLARRSIEKLLRGSPHRKVFSWLERQKVGMKEFE